MVYSAFEFFIQKFLLLRQKKDLILSPLVKLFPDWVNPNFVSSIRLFLVLPLMLIIVKEENANKIFYITVIYSLGFFSDLLDGAIARAKKNESTSGVYLDSIVDKIFIIPLLFFIYLEIPSLRLSILFFIVFKIFLIAILMYQALIHFDKMKVKTLRNYYARIYTAGYVFFFYFLIQDLELFKTLL